MMRGPCRPRHQNLRCFQSRMNLHHLDHHRLEELKEIARRALACHGAEDVAKLLAESLKVSAGVAAER